MFRQSGEELEKKYPFIVVNIRLPQHLVDVNVSPDKRTVMLSTEVAEHIHRILQEHLAQVYQVPIFRLSGQSSEGSTLNPTPPPADQPQSGPKPQTQEQRPSQPAQPKKLSLSLSHPKISDFVSKSQPPSATNQEKDASVSLQNQPQPSQHQPLLQSGPSTNPESDDGLRRSHLSLVVESQEAPIIHLEARSADSMVMGEVENLTHQPAASPSGAEGTVSRYLFPASEESDDATQPYFAAVVRPVVTDPVVPQRPPQDPIDTLLALQDNPALGLLRPAGGSTVGGILAPQPRSELVRTAAVESFETRQPPSRQETVQQKLKEPVSKPISTAWNDESFDDFATNTRGRAPPPSKASLDADISANQQKQQAEIPKPASTAIDEPAIIFSQSELKPMRLSQMRDAAQPPKTKRRAISAECFNLASVDTYAYVPLADDLWGSLCSANTAGSEDDTIVNARVIGRLEGPDVYAVQFVTSDGASVVCAVNVTRMHEVVLRASYATREDVFVLSGECPVARDRRLCEKAKNDANASRAHPHEKIARILLDCLKYNKIYTIPQLASLRCLHGREILRPLCCLQLPPA
eukprot:TRINITY_DN9537_c0_g1_i2.p1 TRINITY_DN9537_c0_g1~~TRINITY_DN9537_c0_g1_i2.p1  ORF type:complete len:579 (+),score=119.41 TRINITY_DN9537_c0_g1_i2:404-2140(+)